MIIDVLICRADGSQELVQREVPDDYMTPPTAAGTDGE
jgi:hypothetical protein